MATRVESPSGSSQRDSNESFEKKRQHNAEPSLPARSVEESLRRGTRLLATLTQAARVARLEADINELQAALDDARSGTANRLQRLLDKFDGEADLPVWAPAVTPPIDAPATGAPGVAFGWSPYLIHARRRLEQLQRDPADQTARDRVPADVHKDDAAVEDDDAGHQPAGGSPRLAVTGADETERPGVPADVHEDEVATDAAARHQPVGDSERLPVTEAPETGRPHVVADRVGPAAIVKNRPMLSGFSFSLAGHLLLLIALFAVTLKVSDPSASLGSQIVSVSAPMENVELVSELQSLEPVELEVADVMEPSIDTSNLASVSEAAALSEIEPVATDALAAATAEATSGSSSAGAVLSAAASSHSGDGSRSAARGSPAMPSTGGKFFGAGAGGNFFCYVVDSSGSMRGAAWESAKVELVRSISTLAEKQRFYIIFFAKEVYAIPQPGSTEPAAHGLAATEENLEHARRWIETVKLDRGGPPNDALELAISREPDAIYLLTDGVTQVDVCGYLRKQNRISDIISGEQVRVPIHAIAYRSLEGQALLRQLARENAGQFHYIPAR